MFPIKTFHSIKDISRGEWQELFPPLFEGYDFTLTLEESLHNQFTFLSLGLYDKNELICFAPCFLLEYALDTTLTGGLKKVVTAVKRLFPRFLTLRILICGSPTGEGKVGLNNAGTPERLTALVNALRTTARQNHAQLIAFKDFAKSYDQTLGPLLKNGFHKILNYPLTKLELPFKSFDEYFATLSAATRKDLKRKFKKVDGVIALRMEVQNAPGPLIDEIYDLYLHTYEKGDVHFEKVTKDFFVKISERLPQETKFFLWFLDDKLVAMDFCLINNGALIDEYIGLHPDYAHLYHLYFVTFRDILSWCIQNGITAYWGGTINYDPKKRLDFQFLPQYIYVRHINPLINFFFGGLCEILKPENNDPVLKELKSQLR